ncbi:MAG: metal-binding protein [Legionella sp.]|nr:MAG: metal-binding protein [Legionella sp.]
MTRSLKILAKQAEPSQMSLTLSERLPDFIQSPCQVDCVFRVDKRSNYFQLSLIVTGQVTVICQRCLATFEHQYAQESQIALCSNDEVAEKLMSSMDCMVHPEEELDLVSIVTDELHLFCPEKHPDPEDCDESAQRYLQSHDKNFV